MIRQPLTDSRPPGYHYEIRVQFSVRTEQTRKILITALFSKRWRSDESVAIECFYVVQVNRVIFRLMVFPIAKDRESVKEYQLDKLQLCCEEYRAISYRETFYVRRFAKKDGYVKLYSDVNTSEIHATNIWLQLTEQSLSYSKFV